MKKLLLYCFFCFRIAWCRMRIRSHQFLNTVFFVYYWILAARRSCRSTRNFFVWIVNKIVVLARSHFLRYFFHFFYEHTCVNIFVGLCLVMQDVCSTMNSVWKKAAQTKRRKNIFTIISGKYINDYYVHGACVYASIAIVQLLIQ